MGSAPFVIVANRLPVSVSKERGSIVIRPSSGGLATAMASFSEQFSQLQWVGWPGINADELTAADRHVITRKLRAYHCYPLFLSREEIAGFYEGYANATLWPLFHYFQQYAKFDPAAWTAYERVNNRYARAITRVAAPRATIWIHDYHLMLLPALVRKQLPEAAIGFFLHTPFPASEIFRVLPQRRAILEGLLGADLIGFHTYDYAHHFLSSVRRVLGLPVRSGSVLNADRTVIVDAFPIGIDYIKFAGAAHRPETREAAAVLREYYRGKRLILSVDRLDYSKGIPERLQAFEHYLKSHPAAHRTVCLAIVAVPSRTELASYSALRENVEQTISRINGTYATTDWTPISYQFKNLPFEQVAALYARADVMLVTPLRDGMNLVAKEYVATHRDGGVLILSEFAGAADELQEALLVNPNDTGALATALAHALTIPAAEQRRRLQAMQARISHYTVGRWAEDFTEQLALARNAREHRTDTAIDRVLLKTLLQDFRRAPKRTFLLDYDGTLRPFVNTPDPAYAAPSPELRRLLHALAQKSGTSVCIISGRAREALEEWFGAMQLTLVAEHGAWIRPPNGRWKRGITVNDTFKPIVAALLGHYVERTPGARVEEKDVSLVWHYRNVPPELAYARNRSLRHELQNALTGTDVGIFDGDKIIEIKPHGAQKGAVLPKLLGGSISGFIFCAGDDYTDEDMFAALPPDAYTVKVGNGRTRAQYHIAIVPQLLGLLEKLAAS